MKEEVNMNKYKKIIKVVSIADTKLKKRVEDLELSTRTMNCLKLSSYWLGNDKKYAPMYLEDLTALSDVQLLRTPNFGRKSLNEIKEVLAEHGMTLGNEEKKDYLVINTINTFEVIPGKTYTMSELEDFLETRGIEFHIIPREIRDIERVNAVRELT